ncbi:hypothetical protein Tco_1405646 [Tanacetum coccineum]
METQKPLLKDEDGEEVDVHMYRSMIGSLMYLTSSRPDIMFVVCACARYQVNPKVSHLHAMKRIFRYLKGQPKLGLWYLKDSPFDLVSSLDSDYARASLDRKSTTGGKAKKSVRLMMEKVIGIEFELLLGEGSAIPTDPQHTPTILHPSTSQPKKTQTPRELIRMDTEIPQSSGPTEHVADEAVHKKRGDSLVRAATTASSLEAEQVSGSGPRCQETMDTIDQTRFESVSKHSNDLLLARGNTLQSDEDRLNLTKLMELCTNLQQRVLGLEDELKQTKTTHNHEVAKLKKRVKKLEKRTRSRTHGLKRLHKVGMSRRVVFSDNEKSLEQEVAAKDVNLTVDEVTLAQALAALKSVKPKCYSSSTKDSATTTTTATIPTPTPRKGIVITELGTPTIMRYSQQPSQVKVQDKGKGKMVEPELVKKISKRD